MGLSAVVITNKDPKEIGLTLDSIKFADETIILRDHPQYQPLKGNFAAQRNLGLKKAKNDWVLFVDDDEIVSRDLAHEINDAIKKSNFQGFYFKRLDRYYGQTLNYGETGKINIIRLGKKGRGEWVRPVHETWKIKGKIGELKSPLIHNRIKLTSPFIERIILYSPIDARELAKEGKPFSYLRLILYPIGKFIVNYLLKLGLLDGYLGLFHAYLMSVQSLSVRVFQWSQKY